ncbi:MBL fold metallo-hydrolase [Clostridium sp. Ade.TY]|uniref:MBL fold metallo-hydrolase n=1 Tax=Clostridium sp. Ade.TY TaxID=1391647 RepID=UPI00040A0029|nr:MBL fold metallo-hydrolase [Clostridium sp. Ade.TY]
MEITWIQNSTFLIKTSIGKRLLIDPFNKFHNCNLSHLNPNVVTLSSEFSTSFCLPEISKDIQLITCPGTYNTEIGRIIGYPSFSDKLKGNKRGPNTIYTYEIDNLKICHLGYIGEIPSKEFLTNLNDIDILFIPVGGHINISGKDAFLISKQLNPKIIIPMNYKTSCSSFLFEGIKEFLLLTKDLYKNKSKSIVINENNINDFNKVVLLSINNQ